MTFYLKAAVEAALSVSNFSFRCIIPYLGSGSTVGPLNRIDDAH